MIAFSADCKKRTAIAGPRKTTNPVSSGVPILENKRRFGADIETLSLRTLPCSGFRKDRRVLVAQEKSQNGESTSTEIMELECLWLSW